MTLSSVSTDSPSKLAWASAAPVEVVNAYLDSFYSGDFERARSVVSEGFSFRGPFLEVEGRDAFFAGAEGLRQIVRGHRLVRQWVDGPAACSIYEVSIVSPGGAGAVLMSEWHTVSDGKLESARVVFDTAAFRSLVSPAGAADNESTRG